MDISEYIVKKITDPTGILVGERYEFLLYITLDEDDELYSEAGTGIRAILAVDEGVERITTAYFFERSTEKSLNFEMEDDEKEAVLQFCKLHYQE